MIFGAIEGTRRARLARIDRRERGGTYRELAESVEFDLEGVRGTAFADGFDFAGLS